MANTSLYLWQVTVPKQVKQAYLYVSVTNVFVFVLRLAKVVSKQFVV